MKEIAKRIGTYCYYYDLRTRIKRLLIIGSRVRVPVFPPRKPRLCAIFYYKSDLIKFYILYRFFAQFDTILHNFCTKFAQEKPPIIRGRTPV